MRALSFAVSLLVLVLSAATAAGREAFPYPPQLNGARVETYKTAGDTRLQLHIFGPPAPQNAPAIVFFFGGGWTSGSPQQFEAQCRHFASRGMVAITADYRVKSRHGVNPTQCLADARSAMRWVRSHAASLGIDPARIAAGGGSAGGHLAACTAFISAFDEPGEDPQVSAAPNALVLFNPALVLAPLDGLKIDGNEARVSEERMGTQAVNISPAHHVTAPAPPAIIFHGKADTTVPFATAEAFVKIMKEKGTRCELAAFDGQPHGFFNREPFRSQTIDAADTFLVSLGWLKQR
jgi:acetyl esterase/lipase